jgi:hypothetical protein
LEDFASQLLKTVGCRDLHPRVYWNPTLRTTAGMAMFSDGRLQVLADTASAGLREAYAHESVQRLARLEPDTIEPAVNAAIRIVAWEDDYVVFDKPAPLPMHPCGRFHRNSMTKILSCAFPGEHLTPAHRLDANTTGLVVFARSRHAAKAIQPQFERGLAGKTYLCRVAGHPTWNDTTSRQPIARTPSNNGFRVVDRDAGDAAERPVRRVLGDDLVDQGDVADDAVDELLGKGEVLATLLAAMKEVEEGGDQVGVPLAFPGAEELDGGHAVIVAAVALGRGGGGVHGGVHGGGAAAAAGEGHEAVAVGVADVEDLDGDGGAAQKGLEKAPAESERESERRRRVSERVSDGGE